MKFNCKGAFFYVVDCSAQRVYVSNFKIYLEGSLFKMEEYLIKNDEGVDISGTALLFKLVIPLTFVYRFLSINIL